MREKPPVIVRNAKEECVRTFEDTVNPSFIFFHRNFVRISFERTLSNKTNQHFPKKNRWIDTNVANNWFNYSYCGRENPLKQ